MKLQTNWSLEPVYSYVEPTNQSAPPTEENTTTQQPSTSEIENGVNFSWDLNPSQTPTILGDPPLPPTTQGNQ